MKLPRAILYLSLLLVCALAISMGCSSAPTTVVYKDRVVKVPQPIRAPVDYRLTQDCPPRFDLPLSPTVEDSWKRLGAVEEALILCRKQLKEIRETN
jgi:hypothetical protein